MFYTLDRIEGDFAVLTDSDGRKTDVLSSQLSHHSAGSIYELYNGSYIYNEKQTQQTKKQAAERLKKIFG